MKRQKRNGFERLQTVKALKVTFYHKVEFYYPVDGPVHAIDILQTLQLREAFERLKEINPPVRLTRWRKSLVQRIPKGAVLVNRKSQIAQSPIPESE